MCAFANLCACQCAWFARCVCDLSISPGTPEQAVQPFPWNPGSRKTKQHAGIHVLFLLMKLIDRTQIPHPAVRYGFLHFSSAGLHWPQNTCSRSYMKIPTDGKGEEKESQEWRFGFCDWTPSPLDTAGPCGMLETSLLIGCQQLRHKVHPGLLLHFLQLPSWWFFPLSLRPFCFCSIFTFLSIVPYPHWLSIYFLSHPYPDLIFHSHWVFLYSHSLSSACF